ncbi:HlyD family efflux transporter periplasmic adaptor subunit [Mycolicibacterium confluentis]|uniref:Lipoyl-binding domain-containing protein n=1 Tax=Mycolicibacterium confluentis TaxID=28047 RepID=A0A7I7XTV3_9MYCO|nr:HlyD family efflux transporter periplasmic adaptor subunit [Mycolicibacterium confluentis]MCV7320897.1 HlyD family efflux transporter periplasmic adaptor subunit [Mycolicibacterium confluentis]ORV27061.1 hypothetical protein AWB99_20040 [Mycolicibacterium confluentis]BBZ32700.1 hypothetical protein MCNF_13050 [Mycolicibacterium confluentis]
MATSATDDIRDSQPSDAVIARLPVTDRRTWLGLVAVALLLVAATAWAAFGRTPETINGNAMIVPTHGFIEVGAPTAGTVTAVLVAPGQEVTSGQTVVTLSDPDRGELDVKAPADGLVGTVLVHAGSTVGALSTLTTIDPTMDGNIAVAFVPADQGTRISPGMRANVSLASVPSSEFGTVTGTVTSVAALPVSAARIQLLVGGNEQLPTYFLSEGPMVEVDVALDTDADSPSGYAWSFGSGPDKEITTGTLAQVSVILGTSTLLEKLVK